MKPRGVPVAAPSSALVPSAPLALASADEELVARIRAGDAAAFEALYRAHVVPLTAFIRGYVVSREIAEELVQDVLCRIWEQRATWRVKDTVRTYLYAAARNHALNHLRHNSVGARWSREAGVGLAASGMGQRAERPDASVGRAELREAIGRGLAALPARMRQACVLRWQHQLGLAEIAEVMGISVKGAEMALMRGTRALRARLAPYFDRAPIDRS
jgi:RNA polymerase sigma-70 factor (ECF subfamily)